MKAKTATIYDSGTAPVTGTTRASVGTAIANVLKHLAETANRTVRTCTAVVTQNDILLAFEEATEAKWNVTKADIKDVLADAKEALKKQ